MSKQKLSDRSCQALPKGTPALDKKQINSYRQELNKAWKVEGKNLVRELKFDDYYQTMSSVIAIAMLAQHEDHHPDLLVSYNKLVIHYSTHSTGGLSDNDFISAAKIDALMPHA